MARESTGIDGKAWGDGDRDKERQRQRQREKEMDKGRREVESDGDVESANARGEGLKRWTDFVCTRESWMKREAEMKKRR